MQNALPLESWGKNKRPFRSAGADWGGLLFQQLIRRLKKTFCLVPSGYNFTEKTLRDMLKAAGGKWVPKEKSWFVPYGAIRGTELEERIPEGLFKKKRGE